MLGQLLSRGPVILFGLILAQQRAWSALVSLLISMKITLLGFAVLREEYTASALFS